MDRSSRFVPIPLAAPTIPNTPSPQQVERERAEERKRIEKEKLAITTRHRVLATILQRVSAPLKKADLLAIAHYLIGHLSYSQVPALAKRHKVEAKKDSASAQELLTKQVTTYDEAELCKLVLEIRAGGPGFRISISVGAPSFAGFFLRRAGTTKACGCEATPPDPGTKSRAIPHSAVPARTLRENRNDNCSSATARAFAPVRALPGCDAYT